MNSLSSSDQSISPSIQLSVVMPAFQEEENLRLLLPRVKASLAELGILSEILVIDTIIPLDATPSVCNEQGARCVSRKGGENYGDAVRTGISASHGELIIFMDSDGSHSPEWIPKLYSNHKYNDVVIASRYVDEGFTENNWALKLMSKTLNLTYSMVLGIRCKDVSNSYRLYRGNQLRELHLKSSNFDIVEEILFKLSKAHPNLRILEVPFTFKQRMFGKTKRNLPVFIATYLFTLIKLRFYN